MPILNIERVSDAIARHQPAHYELRETTRQAAVAIILRQVETRTEALFILRSKNEGDPWSGQMAFPGGHLEPDDENLVAAAVRETLEEIGLDLARHGRYLGEIDHVKPNSSELDMVVTPFVFLLESTDFCFTPNYEVADVLWGSLHDMYSGEALTTVEFEFKDERHRYPGYDVGQEVVWGLTYRMLDQFFGILNPGWVPQEAM